jgi:hypothetical protein
MLLSAFMSRMCYASLEHVMGFQIAELQYSGAAAWNAMRHRESQLNRKLAIYIGSHNKL